MTDNIWVVIPAAGRGTRMASEIPKQYLTIFGQSVLEISVKKFLALPNVKGVMIALAPGDDYFPKLEIASNHWVQTCTGGTERADSVRAALTALLGASAADDDWVMVHDAARPCVSHESLQNLIKSALESDIGAILASPAADTLKRIAPCNQSNEESNEESDDASAVYEIDATLDRENIWHAHTPQMFKAGILFRALDEAYKNSLQITDEASAIESTGAKPLIVPDVRSNIKITVQEDLLIAAAILRSQDKAEDKQR